MPRRKRSEPRRKRDELTAKIGARIAQLREERNLTREQLSYGFGIAKGTISELEKGFVRPSLRMLERIAKALNVKVLDLLTFPADNVRHTLVDVTRGSSAQLLRRLIADVRRP